MQLHSSIKNENLTLIITNSKNKLNTLDFARKIEHEHTLSLFI